MSPDSTSFVSLIINNPQTLLELIRVILAVIALLITIIPKIYRWWRNFSDRHSLKKRLGAELYTKEDILRAAKFYIKPNCQDVDPSQEEEIQLVHAVKNKLFEMVDELLKNSEKFKYLIVLADSGMGKTAFVLKYYARHWRSRRRHKFDLALIPLEIKNVDNYIKTIPSQSNTVLLLDAFDEDTLAIQNHRQRLAKLLELCEGFRQVLITSRTQFFRKEEEIPRETGIIKFSTADLGDNREYVFYKLYLSPFSDKQVNRYLKRRFHLWQQGKCRRVREIIEKIPQLTVRPMLLAYIPDLVKLKKQFNYSFQLYEEMIDKWLERERPFVRKKEELQNFSEQLAIDLYQKREERGSERIHYSELEPWARSFGINLKDWQLRGRSLLNRDVAGNYKFAHRSIMEYLFVKRFLEIPPEHRFQMKWTDQMYQFLIEIMRHQLLISQKLPDFTNIELKGLASLKPMPFFILRKNKKRIKDNEVEAMIKKFDFFDSTRNNKGKGIPHLYMKFKQEKDEIFIVDYTTGLIWQQSGSSERMGYEQIKRWIQDLNQKGFAGYHDWRLPTLEEAMSLLEPAKKNADLYIDPIFDSKQWWISTIDSVQDTSGQWVVGFGSGYCFPDISFNYVRAVRSEQSSPKSFYNRSDGPRAHSTIFKD